MDIDEVLGELADAPGRIRYGKSTSQKEALARARALPGAPLDTSAGQEKADRYASGYLFAQNWPRLAPIVQPYVDALKTSDLPLFGGETPESQSYATAGMNRALIERGNESRPKILAAKQAAALRGGK